MGDPSMGHATRVGIGDSSPVTKQLEFLSCGLAKRAGHVESPGIRGTRSHHETQVVEGTYAADGPLVLDARPDDLNSILKYILGTGPTSEVYSVAETLPSFDVVVDKKADIFTYASCKVARATFRSARNQPLQVTLEIAGTSETDGTTFPAISATLSEMRPYVHHNLVCTLGGDAWKVDNVEVVIDNALLLDNYWNSQFRTEMPEGDRIVTVSMDLPFSATEYAEFYDLALTGLVGELKWSQSGAIFLDMDFVKLQMPTEGPPVPARNQELIWRPSFRARATTAAKEIIITNSIA